ncbi:MAG: homoserine kinase [Sphingomonas sp. SCN 67-18]|uniref:homoserine kinase n=1 Tax=uncultured Sphingomonas sp. TaxID=158754 RepID=UPI00086F6FD1|nr:homoserine kinase [Sphingomonas sp. SCN 67-18]ODU20228.1 MAG: homoserine kinase [Sphingomonas sp. SCN 67-18]
MAVYTQVSAEQMAVLLARYDAGELVSAKGIAEGVENSNYLVETSRRRFILTLYEKRVDAGDLPFFLALLDHLAASGNAVPRAVPDREGRQIHEVAGRPACLIEFLPGVSVTHPTPAQSRAAGEALGRMHGSLASFTGARPNTLGPAGWHALAARCGADLDAISAGLGARVAAELAYIDAHWPADLPRSVIHADLFPDNVLMRGDAVTGVIDFYFACTEVRAWDVAVTHTSWCFEPDGTGFHADRAAALIAGYEAAFGLSEAERTAFAVLARGAALRFLLTRAWDWLNTPADAMVTRKDPLAFLRRLDFYAGAERGLLLGA